jgi:hypothetical protein
MYFDFEYYKGKSVVIHCKSKTQAKKWCKLMHKNGLKWSAEKCESYFLRNSYNWYTTDTCYSLHGSFGSVDWYERRGYTIIEFEDIITGKYDRREKMFTKKHLRNGDYVKLRNGELGIYIINGGFIADGYSIDDTLFDTNLIYTPNSNCDIVEVRRFYDGIPPIRDAFSRVFDKYIIYQRKEQKLWNGMTYEEAHRKLWNALADGEVQTKSEWFEKNNKNNELNPYEKCFACETALKRAKETIGKSKCVFCPLCESTPSTCLNGLYNEWMGAAKGFERFKLAHEIANLPWKEK